MEKKKVATNSNICWPAMRHKKNFLREPLNYLAVLMQNFRQIEKYITGQKMLFFSQTVPGKLYKPNFCCTIMQLSWQNKPSSISQLGMKEEAARRKRGPRILFSCKELPAHQRWIAKEKIKVPRRHCLSTEVTQNFMMIPGWTKLNCSVCPGSGQSPQEHKFQLRQRKTKPHVRERKKHMLHSQWAFHKCC